MLTVSPLLLLVLSCFHLSSFILIYLHLFSCLLIDAAFCSFVLICHNLFLFVLIYLHLLQFILLCVTFGILIVIYDTIYITIRSVHLFVISFHFSLFVTIYFTLCHLRYIDCYIWHHLHHYSFCSFILISFHLSLFVLIYSHLFLFVLIYPYFILKSPHLS